MDLGLKGKRALVTGSTAGIGLATVRALASEGAHVTVNGRTEARVNSVLLGPTASEGAGKFLAQMPTARGIDAATAEREFFATARPSSVLQRFATPDEVAAMITYVCSLRP